MGFSGVMAWYCFLDSLVLLYTIIVFVLLLSLQSRATIAYVAIVSFLRVDHVSFHMPIFLSLERTGITSISFLPLQMSIRSRHHHLRPQPPS
jgi:hypothetical protein